MRRWIRPLFAAAAIAWAPHLVVADDAKAPDSAKLFGQLDVNGDEAVTENEVPKDKQPLLHRLMRTADKNGDGRLSREEFVEGLNGNEKPKSTDEKSGSEKPTANQGADKAEGGGAPGAKARPGKGTAGGRNLGQLRQKLKDADKNGDGKLSKQEMPERLKPLFGRLDKDGDGLVDSQELRAGMEQLREQGALQGKQQGLKGKKQFQKKVAVKKGARQQRAKIAALRKRELKQNAKREQQSDDSKSSDSDKPA